MSTKYINLIEAPPICENYPRTSALGLNMKKVKRNGIEWLIPESFRVVGVLPHGYSFRPKNAAERDGLVRLLNDMEYNK